MFRLLIQLCFLSQARQKKIINRFRYVRTTIDYIIYYLFVYYYDITNGITKYHKYLKTTYNRIFFFQKNHVDQRTIKF